MTYICNYNRTTHRKCKKCGIKSIKEFTPIIQPNRYGELYTVYRCKACRNLKAREQKAKDPKKQHAQTNKWRKANRGKARAIVKKCYDKNCHNYLSHSRDMTLARRWSVLDRYSNSKRECSLCQENHWELLVVDHIKGGGTKHRKEVTGLGSSFYIWIINNQYPDGYRVLCHNCNFKELVRKNQEDFANKVWDETNSFKTRVCGDKIYQVDLKKMAITSKKHKLKRKLKCLIHYGSETPVCHCCSFSDFDALSIDHIEGGGRKHSKEIKISLYHWLIKNKFPPGFRVLCLNCNFSNGIYGYCPHKS